MKIGLKTNCLLVFGYAMITSAETQQVAFENSLYSDWHSMTVMINDQRIPGCFLDFGAERTWVASQELCSTRPCAYESPGLKSIAIQTQETEGGVIGNTAIASFQFGSVQVASSFLLANQSAINWSCRLGLSPGPNGIFQKLMDDKSLDSNTLSFYSLQEGGGRLVFGGVDTLRNTTAIEWIPVVKENSWKLSLSKINMRLDDLPGLEVSVMAKFNDFTFLPNDLAREMNEKLGLRSIPGSFHNGNGWAMECAEIPTDLPTINFQFGKTIVSVGPREYLLRTTAIGTTPLCFSTIVGIPAQSELVPSLGSLTLRNYLFAFDFENLQIGIARANRATGLEAQLTAIRAPFKVFNKTTPGLAGWIIAVIVVSCLLFVVILVFLIRYICIQRKRNSRQFFIRQTPHNVHLPGPYGYQDPNLEPRKRIVQVNPNQYGSYDDEQEILELSTIEMERPLSPEAEYQPHFPIPPNSNRPLSPVTGYQPHFPIPPNSGRPISPASFVLSETHRALSPDEQNSSDPSQNLNRFHDNAVVDPSQNLNNQIRPSYN